MRVIHLLLLLLVPQLAFAGRPNQSVPSVRGLPVTFEVVSMVDRASCRIVAPAKYAGVEFMVPKADSLYESLARGERYRFVVRGYWRARFEERRVQKARDDEFVRQGGNLMMISDTLRIYELRDTDVIGPLTKRSADKRQPNQSAQTTPRGCAPRRV
jgi:hypothetical protein